MTRVSDAAVRRAVPGDGAAVLGLLASAGLPAAGVADGLSHFLIAEAGGRLVAVAGLELYGDDGLLRSVAVLPAWRGRGLAAAMTEALAREAAARGVRRLYLLTETAEPYFARQGFQRIPREEASAGVRQSAEFREACADSAVLMRRSLAAPTSP